MAHIAEVIILETKTDTIVVMLERYIEELPFYVVLRRSRKARHYRLAVYIGGRVELVLPRRGSDEYAQSFLEERRKWIRAKVSGVTNGDIARYDREHYLENKEEARACLEERIALWGKVMAVYPKRISIRSMKTRWGSCSGRGNISLNYKIMFLPEELQDYIVVHELCHLKEANHSRRFWSEVEAILPDYKKCHRKIRDIC